MLQLLIRPIPAGLRNKTFLDSHIWKPVYDEPESASFSGSASIFLCFTHFPSLLCDGPNHRLLLLWVPTNCNLSLKLFILNLSTLILTLFILFVLVYWLEVKLLNTAFSFVILILEVVLILGESRVQWVYSFTNRRYSTKRQRIS